MTPNATSETSKDAWDLPAKTRAEKARAKRILDGFYKHYPNAQSELDFANPCELLVATILSAQATDAGVNKVTPALFKAFPRPRDYAQASPERIEQYIRSIGLFRNKAKSIHAAMTTIVEQFDSEVPRTMDELLTLRGVARKTANVVLSSAFGINEGVAVDTHVIRVSYRFGLTHHNDAGKIEKDLMALFPRTHWGQLSHMLILHGRRVCRARGAICAEHPLCKRYCSNAKPLAASR